MKMAFSYLLKYTFHNLSNEIIFKNSLTLENMLIRLPVCLIWSYSYKGIAPGQEIVQHITSP